MASKLTRDEVQRVAALARLQLTEQEVELFAHQLTAILQYADDIKLIDTTGIEPTSHALSGGPMWRDDRPVPSLDRDEMVKSAPEAAAGAGLYRVPKVL